MVVRKLRLQRGWSQDQLAQLSALSVRTIQRVERGQKPGLETSRSLAAVFEVDISTFMAEDQPMNKQTNAESPNTQSREQINVTPDEEEAMNYAKGIKEFYTSLSIYAILVVTFVIAGFHEPEVYWVFAGLGIGLILQGLLAYEIISLPWQNFERRIIEKRLGRKL